MSNCLGLYIEENLIKYAKISKNHDNIKMETFGVNFYDNLEKAITQIVEETDSQKTPISINLSEEMYSYFDMFALLSKNDLQKAIKTEFESFCTNKGYNPNVFETRYAIMDYPDDKEKIKVIHIAGNKMDLNKSIQTFKNYKLINISPVSISIASLLDVTQENQNALIVNIENNTTITTIIDNKIYNIEKIEQGAGEFLPRINNKENSYAKSYEICKNTTIYTSEGKEFQDENNYLDDIMPTLYNIVGEVRKIINTNINKINKVYITGTASLINNVDLYFQEYLEDIECEILKPYFVENIGNINIKDYIEVNSAISLALIGLGEGISGMNFKKATFSDKVPDWLKVEVSNGNVKKQNKKGKDNKKTNSKIDKYFSELVKWDLGQKLDKKEIALIRVATSVLILIVIYTCFSILLSNQINKKQSEAEESIQSTKEQIENAERDKNELRTKISQYNSAINQLKDAENEQEERVGSRNAIPNLLNQIMSIIPINVQLTSIEDTGNGHIIINAQSDKYEQLGYFVAKMKADVILRNITSTAGQKDGGVVTIKIEGDLPI